MPPQGLLLIAAYMPDSWPVRFIDENIAPATDADLAWADVVMVSGMHIQAEQIHDITRRAHAAGKVGGARRASVSASPEMYPDVDYLHIGEMGDATDALIRLHRRRASRRRARTDPLPDQGPPAAHQDFPVPGLRRDPARTIPAGHAAVLVGLSLHLRVLRHPRPLRPPAAHEDAAADHRRARLLCFSQPNPPTTLYFVDDNFIGNRKAAKEMLPHLVEWQKKNHYPVMFACEATLNIAKQTEILALMKEANFIGMFVGIETPEADALNAMKKGHNNAVPMLESIRDAEQLRDRSHVRHHRRARHRRAGHRAAAEGLHRRLQYPDADHQSAAGAAEDAAVGPAQARRTAVGRRRAREQRGVPAPARRGGRDVAAKHRLRERSRSGCSRASTIRSLATYVNRKVTPAKGKLTWPNLRGAAVLAWRTVLYC